MYSVGSRTVGLRTTIPDHTTHNAACQDVGLMINRSCVQPGLITDFNRHLNQLIFSSKKSSDLNRTDDFTHQ